MSNIVQLVQEQEQLFVPAVVDKSVEWGRECQFAIQAFQANDFLAKTALNNPTSAQNAIINIAAIGISMNPALKHAYLVPRKGGVCLDISYMGMMHLAQESGSIRWGQAVIVRAKDDFRVTGLGDKPVHNYSPFGDRGDIVGVYCCVKTSDGDFLTECMSIDDVYAIRARSESFKRGNGPWCTDPEEMIKKTVVKRAYKYWPKVKRLATAIEYQNTVAGEGVDLDQEPVMPHTSAEQEAEVKAQSDAKLAEEVQPYINQMGKAKSEEDLKNAFAPAYKMTKGRHEKMNQQVQKIYNDNKTRIKNGSAV